jgi:energy-coupling factor transport system ATP-binding protein
MSWIDVLGFSYTYPGKEEPVLRDISLSIKRGAFVVITGESGSGKSTLGKALAGFLFQDEKPNYEGRIIVNGVDMTLIPLYDASQHVAYVQQNPEDQFCTLSVSDEIAFGLENLRVDSEKIECRIDESLAVVKGLDLKERLLANLSGGEKQKVAIASMLALSPDVLILDEPTSNLDPDATLHVFKTLYDMRQNQELTVIIIEHKLELLKAFNPQVFVLEYGEISPIQDMPTFKTHLSEKTYSLPKLDSVQITQKEPLITLSSINVHLGGYPILHDIDLSILPGEFIALMGPNGSGKSTLLQTMMGFHKPESGMAMAFGKELSSTKMSSLVGDIGFIFQNPDHQLLTHSVWDEATLTSENLNILTQDQKDRAEAYLNSMGLGERKDEHPQRLSYGEKRRLNLLAVLLHHPKLLLIDEFLIGQDMANAHAWMKFFKNCTRQGLAVLLVNHHADLTCQYCDRIVFLSEGRIVIDQPVSQAIDPLLSLGFSSFVPEPKEVLAYA